MTGYYDLSATERDLLLAAATAPASVGEQPHKHDVHKQLEAFRGDAPTKASTYVALDRLESVGAVRIAEIDGRSKGVTVTPSGQHMLHDAAARLTSATEDNYSEHDNER